MCRPRTRPAHSSISDRLCASTYSRRRSSERFAHGPRPSTGCCDVSSNSPPRGRPGPAALRSLLVERDPSLAPAESDLETLLSKILRDGGLPAPVRQFEVVVAGQRFRLDAAYPELMIFMEGDGFGVHSPRGPFERDRSRQNLLVVAGWLPLRFTWRRLCRAAPGCRERGARGSTPPPAQFVAFGHLVAGGSRSKRANCRRRFHVREVREGGLEPPHPCGRRHLKPVRLPFPPLARDLSESAG